MVMQTQNICFISTKKLPICDVLICNKLIVRIGPYTKELPHFIFVVEISTLNDKITFYFAFYLMLPA